MSTNSFARAAPLAALMLFILSCTTSAQNANTSAESAASKAEEHLRLYRQYLEAFDAAAEGALKKFVAEHLSGQGQQGPPPERLLENILGFRRMIGPLEIYEVE